ncbi:MAG: hypothetical protein ACD_80C00046G0013 [uncultured bacterium (gcode 4)]|uniref:LamG-like jellyroll fold domain-containing protein n=1 Tax=uncultured bacterium (gcode 4) TaxID=1234023 RepID=K1XJS7_9BACT|nr:MAG: hypothetical protein ACD_80C00046G0013 [uncultured bacterium (gcode 4)]
MCKFCDKKFYPKTPLDFVQRFCCNTKKHTNHIHKKIIHHVHKRKHHWVSYIHILLLLVVFLLYNITTFNTAQEVILPPDQTPIIIENEPQIIPDRQTGDTTIAPEQVPAEAVTWTAEILSWELFSWEILTWEMLSWEILTWEILTWEMLSWEILSWEILSWEVLTWEILTWENLSWAMLTWEIITWEITSGVILTWSEILPWVGEILSWISPSGEIISEEILTWEILTWEIFSWEIVTWWLSTWWLLTEIISPDTISGLLLWLDASAYDSLLMNSNERISTRKDKRDNGIEATMSEAGRRPTYETDIISGHPAIYFDDVNDGLGTNIIFEAPYTIYTVFNVENPYLANTRVLQGLNNRYLGTLNYRLTHATSGSIIGEWPYTSPDFVIASIRNDWTETYVSNNGISITENSMYNKSPTWFGIGSFWFTQDEPLGWYVSEVLVYDNSLPLEKRLEILAYLDDKYPNRSSHSLHSYAGDAEVVAAEAPIIDITPLTGETILATGAGETWIVIPVVEPIVEPIVPEIIIPPVQEIPQISTGEILSWEILTWEILTWEIETWWLSTELIVTGYFDTAYDKWSYDDKIIQLQKLLTWMQMYTGAWDGIYSDEVIDAVYTYQTQNWLLIGQETNKAVRGYLGPKTRKALNQSYVEYQNYEISLQQQLQEQLISTWEILTETWWLSTGVIETWINEIIIPITGQETLDAIGTLSWVNTIDVFAPAQEVAPSIWDIQISTWWLSTEIIETWNILSETWNLSAEVGVQIETWILETTTWTLLPAPWTLEVETWTTEIVLPTVEQEVLNEIGTLPWVNTIVLFDPLSNPLLFSGLLLDTGFQSALSGFVYTSWAQIGLVFTTWTSQEITAYLQNLGYVTGTMTLVPVNTKTLVGDVAMDFADLSGVLLVPVVFQSVNELAGHIAEVQLPAWTLLKTADGSLFTGELTPPVFQDPATVEQYVDQDVVAVIDVWADEHIQFEDTGGNNLYATFRVPVPGMNIGDTVDVNYSEDGVNRTYMNSVNVQIIDDESYAVFYANHFTTFYLGTDTWTFLINNDTTYTTWLAVTLNNSVSWAVQMRFWNSIAQRDATSWVAYATGYSWNLTWTDGDGIKRVYAQFSGNGVVRNVSDSIIYDTSSGTLADSLQTYLDSSNNGSVFYDLANANDFTNSNASSATSSWEQYMTFNGTNAYVYNNTDVITGYPFSFSTRVKPTDLNWAQVIYDIARSSSNSRYRGIMLNGNKAAIISSNSTETITNGSTTLQAGKRYHIVWVFNSSTSKRLYVNGILDATQTTSVSFSTSTSNRMTIGRMGDSSPDRYLNGAVDEVRVYDKALSQTEIDSLYMIPPTFDVQTAFTGTPTLYGEFTPKMRNVSLIINGTTYATTGSTGWKWQTLPMITGLANGTYNVTVNYTNVYGNTWSTIYTAWLTISLPASTWLHITYSPTGFTSGNIIATLTWLDPTYMIINNFWSEFITFTGNGSFIWQYVDKQGTTWYITATVTWIDITQPTFAGVSSWSQYSGNVTITFADANLSWATLSGLNWNTYYSGNFQNGSTVTSDGKYIFTVRDKAGNSTWAIFTINTDVTPPTAYVTYSPGSWTWTNQDVIATLTWFSEIGVTITNNSWSANYTFTDNGSFLFTFQDTAGNIWFATGTVNWIDKIPPTFTWVSTWGVYDYSSSWYIISFGDNNTWVSAVLITYSMASGTVVSSWAYISGTPLIASGHYDYELIVTDAVGNSTWARFHIHYLTFTTIYTPWSGARTSGNVLAVITWFSEPVTDITPATYTFTWNGSFQFSFYHPEGFDTHYSTATVYRIDKEPPTFTWVTEWGTYISASVIFTDNNMGATATISGGNYTWWTYLSDTIINGEWEYTIIIMDIVGNTTSVHFSIDLLVPTAIVTYSPGSWTFTSGNVIATLTWFSKTGVTITNNWWLANYTFTGNGDFVFTFQDTVGNIWSTTATVNRIDKTPPTFTGVSTWGFYPWSVTISFSDDNLSWAILSGIGNSYYSGDFHNNTPFLAPDGKFMLTVYDLAGNSTGATFRVHTSILHFSWIVTGGYYNHDVSIDYRLVHLDPDDSLSWAVLSGLNGNGYYNGNYQSWALITGEWMYRFTVYETDGDRTWAIFTIDKTKPNASIEYSPPVGIATTGFVDATLTWTSEDIVILNNDWLDTITLENNESLSFQFIDLAGNTWETRVYVWRIKPNLWAFTWIALDSEYLSNTELIWWRGTGTVAVSITTGILYKNGVALSGLTTTWVENDEFYITMTSSSDPLITYTSTLTIGDTTGDFTITTMDLPATINGPTSFDFGNRDASTTIQTIEKTFSWSTDYFKVVDRQGIDTGYYTTISISDMNNPSGGSIPYTDIAVKALTGIVTLSWTENPRVYSAITDTYQYFTASPLTFISRDIAANGGMIWTYGLQTIWKIDIPAFQNIGDYSGVITYTLY